MHRIAISSCFQSVMRRISTLALSTVITFPHCTIRTATIPSPVAAMWTDLPADRRPALAPRPQGVAFSPACPQDVQRLSHASAQHQLFPSASRLRCDRRDADHGRARGGRAIHQRRAGRACLSAGAHAASSSTGCSTEIEDAPGIVLYTLLGAGPGRAAGEDLPRARPAVPVDPRAGAAACSSPISAPRPTHGSAPSTCSTPNISSASTR